MTDEAVRELSRAASSHASGRWAIVALGGWGCGCLLPGSDLDILILTGGPPEKMRPFAEAVLYPLWDAGLKVGHQVRSPRQQLAAMRDDLKTCTAALTARAIAGDTAWAESQAASWASSAGKRPGRWIAEIARRPRSGSPYLLEPDLKEGPGGRRDHDEITWISALRSGRVVSGPSDDGLSGLMTAHELSALDRAAEIVASARWELQRDGHGNRMTLDAVECLGAVDPEDVQSALGTTAALLATVRARLHNAATSQEPLSAEELFALLDEGTESLPGLEVAAQSGRLNDLLPQYRSLMRCRRPGLGHELTVGAHSLKAACTIAGLNDPGPLGRSLADSDRRVLQVATLLHDIGKLQPGENHAERGAPEAREVARRFGMSPDRCDVVGELVQQHLSLVQCAVHDDLDDENAVLMAADRIGNRSLLAPLHVLTAVDSISTGPSRWTPWLAALVATLVSRIDSAFSEEVDGAGIASRGRSTREEALAQLPTDCGAERDFIGSASLRYLASRTPSRVIEDARLFASMQRRAGAAATLAMTGGPAPETYTVTVAARERPRLLASLAGAVSLAGLEILSVDAYSAPGDLVLDSFVVTASTKRPVTTETFAMLERLVDIALRDRLELALRLEQRRRHYPTTANALATVKTRPGGWDTIIEVSAPDRPGLLHDIALAVSRAGADIRWARGQTIDGVVRDVFHVVDADGNPIEDPGVMGHLAMHVRDALGLSDTVV